MAINYFECRHCKKMTKHIEISLREHQALMENNAFWQTVAGVNDFIGTTRLFSGILGEKYWKCCECGEPSIRKLNGKIVG